MNVPKVHIQLFKKKKHTNFIFLLFQLSIKKRRYNDHLLHHGNKSASCCLPLHCIGPHVEPEGRCRLVQFSYREVVGRRVVGPISVSWEEDDSEASSTPRRTVT